MLGTARAWVEGWAAARLMPEPVEVPWGLRIDIGRPDQMVRHVLLDADPGAARELIASVTEPTTCVKAFLPGAEMRPWFSSGWEPVESCFLMAVDLRPARVHVPDGYRVTVEAAGDMTCVRVLDADGRVAASGRTGRAGSARAFDQIVTEPAHQRRGLGTVVMGTLTEAALDEGARTGVLGATDQGRALYEALDWKVLAPLDGFAYRPVAR
ncbi:GNAT family N-acetyltransferase [Streptomyces sp. NPDC059917]|uniref:GNAT family N-acetyltransferase n=1 Tax=Streptomyces sp. NPDC059917 TaxID=3347002 RepID=UPI0036693335